MAQRECRRGICMGTVHHTVGRPGPSAQRQRQQTPGLEPLSACPALPSACQPPPPALAVECCGLVRRGVARALPLCRGPARYTVARGPHPTPHPHPTAPTHHHLPRWAGTGRAKKSGAGGKFTWGSMLTDGDEAGGAMDRNDPNYNSGEPLSLVAWQCNRGGGAEGSWCSQVVENCRRRAAWESCCRAGRALSGGGQGSV